MSTIGLADLFGVSEWQATGGANTTANTKVVFEGMLQGGVLHAGQDYIRLLSSIPANAHNTFEFESRSQRGFKFEWTDSDGKPWHVHGHEPDSGAAQGHIGGQSWVIRVRCDGAWLLASQWISNFPQEHRNYSPPTLWSKSKAANVMRLSHIPLVEA